MKISIFFRYIMFAALLSAMASIVGCSDDEQKKFALPEPLVKNALIPANLTVYKNQNVSFQGKGFTDADKVALIDAAGQRIELAVAKVDAKSITVVISDKVASHSYDVVLVRGDREQFLGNTTLRLTVFVDVPDKAGASIKGAVMCGDEPVRGVVVSDGVEVTTTDNNGFYWLNSQKANGYVFISVPSGYEVTTAEALPAFWTRLTKGPLYSEQQNFELKKVDNDDHVMLVSTDLHMANRNNDVAQFEGNYVKDMRALVSSYASKKVYMLCLGDMSWDAYWYDKKYALPEYKKLISDFPMPIFHVMGNHDNDPAQRGDLPAESAYRNELGPTYYSFNIGGIHYVVLDNVVYLNTGTGTGIGVVGDRNYDRYVNDEQLAWLKADLATVTDKSTPIVVGMHCQAYELTGSFGIWNSFNSGKNALLDGCFKDFSNVHYLTGHTHRNYVVEKSASITEHNTAAVCATWWWTGVLVDNQICKDGTYGGYGVYEMSGKDIKWYYKSIGHPKAKQLRSYDMNVVKNYFATDAAALKYLSKYSYRTNYSKVAANTVYINVWNYDTKWKVEASENGTPLTVTRISAEDPLHTISYDVPRAQSASLTSDFVSQATQHIFSVQSSSANSAIEIKVTDRFGNVYTESMTRPKAFNTTME